MSVDISKVIDNASTDYARLQQSVATAKTVKAKDVSVAQSHVVIKADKQPTSEDRLKNLKEAISQLNQQMMDSNQHLGFELNDHIKGPVITVHNTHTGEVVRKIPSDEVLRVAQSIDSLKGVIFNKNL
jgi:flagellar protein FlaG